MIWPQFLPSELFYKNLEKIHNFISYFKISKLVNHSVQILLFFYEGTSRLYILPSLHSLTWPGKFNLPQLHSSYSTLFCKTSHRLDSLWSKITFLIEPKRIQWVTMRVWRWTIQMTPSSYWMFSSQLGKLGLHGCLVSTTKESCWINSVNSRAHDKNKLLNLL